MIRITYTSGPAIHEDQLTVTRNLLVIHHHRIVFHGCRGNFYLNNLFDFNDFFNLDNALDLNGFDDAFRSRGDDTLNDNCLNDGFCASTGDGGCDHCRQHGDQNRQFISHR